MALAPQQTWSCSKCTFENSGVVACEMCSNPRVEEEKNSDPHSTSAAESSQPNRYNKRKFPAIQRCPGAGIGKVRILSWNTDGIFDGGMVSERALEASALILAESPDVILLQELVTESLDIFIDRLGRCGYIRALPASSPKSPYFCGMFVSNCFEVSAAEVRPFACGSGMYRELLSLTVSGGSISNKGIRVFSSHLESLKDDRKSSGNRPQDIRVLQFMEILDEMVTLAEAGQSSIFAGDTNLRVDEASQPKAAMALGRVSSFNAAFRPKAKAAVVDAFEAAGEPIAEKFSWDCQLNDNISWSDGFKPRARYDRCYVSRSLSLVDGTFHLIGTSKFTTGAASIFPSDHFGIVCDFKCS
jgi:exonuclease III